jgi:hypothetical protein
MEKIFDIAKDSEKSWGVIAQGIDNNFEEFTSKVDDITGIFIFNGEAIWGTTLDKKINVSSYQGKALSIKTSSDTAEGKSIYVYQSTTGDSSGIDSGRTITTVIGNSCDIEIGNDIKIIWLFSSIEGNDDKVSVILRYNGYEDITDERLEALENSNADIYEKIESITGVSIFDDSVIWGTTLDKKINVSRYKGKTLKFLASNNSISGTTARLLQTSTDDSSGIIEGKEISVKIGNQYDVEIDTSCKKLWLYSPSPQDDVVLALKVYVNGYEIDTDKAISEIRDDIFDISSDFPSIAINDDTLIVSKTCNDGKTMKVTFAPFGPNLLWQLKNISFYSENGELLISRSTNTDSISPYHVASIYNIDGGNPSAISHFTGGCHGWNGDQSGNATASGVIGYKATKHLITISVTNKIQGYNTIKEDGSGREIIKEEIQYIFSAENDDILVRNSITALEDVKIELYYGLQIAFARDYVRYNCGEKNVWHAKSDFSSYIGDTLDSVEAKVGHFVQRMFLTKKGLGYFSYVPSTLAKAFQEDKVYYNLIRQNVSLLEGESLYFEGGYSFSYDEFDAENS